MSHTVTMLGEADDVTSLFETSFTETQRALFRGAASMRRVPRQRPVMMSREMYAKYQQRRDPGYRQRRAPELARALGRLLDTVPRAAAQGGGAA